MEATKLATEKAFPQGETIISEGQKADFFYIVMEGAVEVAKKDRITGTEYTLATLKKGEVVGEVGLLTDENRIATVRVAVPSVLIQYPIQDFKHKLSESVYSIVSKNIHKILIERLAYSYDNTIVSLKNSMDYAKKRNFFQALSIIILAAFLIQIGTMFYYLFSSHQSCNTVKEPVSVTDVNHSGV